MGLRRVYMHEETYWLVKRWAGERRIQFGEAVDEAVADWTQKCLKMPTLASGEKD